MDRCTPRRQPALSRRMARLSAGLLGMLMVTVAVLPFPAQAAESATAGQRISPLDPQLPWTVEADRVYHDPARDEYIAEGNVLLAKMDRTISADQVRYSRRHMMAYAEGHVILTVGNDRLAGSYLEMDLESERGTLDNGTIFIRESNYHISGNRIERVGADLYAIDRGVVTTCDGDPPDWKISGSDIKVYSNGSGSAWNAVVYARDVPLLYAPYVSFPGKDRQSGFLGPEMGYSSRRGFYYNQPFFWAIDDQSDATVYLEYMSERGWRPGIEYRYYLTRDAKGAAMFDYLHDDKVDTGQGSSTQDWGYPDDGLRPNRDRYWFRMSHINPLPGGFQGRVDLDMPSDQDYLRDFKTGYMGFEDSNAYFNRQLGRVMDEFDDPVRVNRLQITRSWSAVSLDAGALYYNNVTKGVNWKDVTQRLPVVSVTAPKQGVEETGFYTNLSSEYDNFWQERGVGVQRADLWPRVYYPFFFSPYLTIEPSVGWRQTVYDQYKTDTNSSWSDDQYFHRELWDTRTVIGTEVYDIYDVDGERLEAHPPRHPPGAHAHLRPRGPAGPPAQLRQPGPHHQPQPRRVRHDPHPDLQVAAPPGRAAGGRERAGGPGAHRGAHPGVCLPRLPAVEGRQLLRLRAGRIPGVLRIGQQLRAGRPGALRPDHRQAHDRPDGQGAPGRRARLQHLPAVGRPLQHEPDARREAPGPPVRALPLRPRHPRGGDSTRNTTSGRSSSRKRTPRRRKSTPFTSTRRSR